VDLADIDEVEVLKLKNTALDLVDNEFIKKCYKNDYYL